MRGWILVLGLLTVAIQHGPGPTVAEPRYSITISATSTTDRVGSPVKIRIVQENTTHKNQMFWVEKVGFTHGEYLYLVSAVRSDGRSAPRSKYFQSVRDESGNFLPGTGGDGVLMRKKPGESIVSNIDLNELYVLKPGTYTVQVYQNDSVAKMTVKSNVITITVTP